MKVVLFCGGLGMRMREGAASAPKPMHMIGDRPLLWHVMRYYAHFGHTDFILCLGYGAAAVKEYFLRYDETQLNDFTMVGGGRDITLHSTDITDWNVTFIDTGLKSTIGERLMRVRSQVENEEMFLANYADTLTDAPLDELVAAFRKTDAVAISLAVPPVSTHHVLDIDDAGHVTGVREVRELMQWENGGYFVLRPGIFDALREGEDLVPEALSRLLADGKLRAQRYTGFWRAADTFKDKAELEDMFHRGHCPWMLWDVLRSETARKRLNATGSESTPALPRVVDLAPVVGVTRLLALTGVRSVLAVGAHPDDIEIGAGGLLLSLANAIPSGMRVHYVLLTGSATRRAEAEAAASAFLSRAELTFAMHELPDGRLPAHSAAVKEHLHEAEATLTPDLLLCPRADDAHQDHRLVGELVPTVFRRTLVLHYEIPKWDGDLGRPNVYVPLADEVATRKVELLHKHFPSQRTHDWWDDEVFLGLARLRGMECRSRYAEAFGCDKAVVSLAPPHSFDDHRRGAGSGGSRS